MNNTEIVNAKISSCKLKIEREAFLDLQIGLEFDGGVWQGFGGWVLKNVSKDKIDKDSYGIDYIAEVMKVLEIDCLDDAKGNFVRVERGIGYHGKIVAIGNITKNLWFNPEEFGKKYQ